MMRSGYERQVRRILIALAAVGAIAAGCASVATLAAQQNARSGPFTAEQAAAGRALYDSTCSACHLANMKGTFEAPPLSGANFLNTWRNRATSELVSKIRTSMPQNNPGSLSDQEAANLAAFILQANGAKAGTEQLTAATLVPIGAVATGGAAPAAAQGNDEDAPPRATAATRGANVPLGLLVAGEVKNYTPVTDEMLLKPDPADWLIVRGGYLGWNHSTLSQINRENVKDLRLVWSWSMNDSQAANEPTPLVHNGTIYLINTDNILQALDARTGDLIWENHMRPPKGQAGGTGAMRNMAIYQDKVFAETTDAHLFALDARTGKTVWDVVIGDSSKGYGNSSGPIIIHGKVIQGENGCDRYKAQDKEQGCFISALRSRRPENCCGASIPLRGPASPAAIPGATCRNMLRVGGKRGSPEATIRI